MKYTIARILGNELPPRDEPGSRIKALKYVLDNEPKCLKDCKKIWILNQVHDKQLYRNMKELLGDTHTMFFSMKNYASAKNRDEQIRYAININRARNFAKEIGSYESRFTFVLDGDCFFTENLWELTIQSIEKDQERNPNRQYYGIPGVRVKEGDVLNPYNVRTWEPTVVFRNDAEMTFDETIPFGKCDKIELLRRLGYICQAGDTKLTGDLCLNVGRLFHISFSDGRIEEDMELRMKLREESLDKLLSQLSTL